MLQPPSEWRVKNNAQRVLVYVGSQLMQMSHTFSEVTGPKFTKFVAVVTYSSAVLTQQSALRYVHSLSNESGNIKKESNIGKR